MACGSELTEPATLTSGEEEEELDTETGSSHSSKRSKKAAGRQERGPESGEAGDEDAGAAQGEQQVQAVAGEGYYSRTLRALTRNARVLGVVILASLSINTVLFIGRQAPSRPSLPIIPSLWRKKMKRVLTTLR